MAASVPRRSGRPAGAAKAHVVLLVEDDDAVREVLAAAFEAVGMKVEQTTTRAAAIRAARRVSPEVIVLDRQLPDGDGWSAAAQLRRSAGRADGELVVIAMTSHATLSNAERALLAGCEAFLEKPCDPKSVVDTALRLLSSREATTTTRRRRTRDT